MAGYYVSTNTPPIATSSSTIEAEKSTDKDIPDNLFTPQDRSRAIATLKEYTPKDITAIDVIVETYYVLTLHYGNYSKNSIFDKAGMLDANTFFDQFIPTNIIGEERIMLKNQIFKEAFFEPTSPTWEFELPWPLAAAIGGHVVGRKLTDSDTLLVYTIHETQEHLGPTSHLCKNVISHIDKFVFKNIDGEWKVWEITESVDSWDSQEGGDTEEACKEINQDKITKYQTG